MTDGTVATPTQEGWAIRRAELRDAPGLTVAVVAAYAVYSLRIADLPPVADELDRDIAEHAVWVATRGAEILGCAVLMLDAAAAKLANVAVRPDAGGQGIGSALIAAVETHALDCGARRIDLTTHVDMPENAALYSRLGWRETGRKENRLFMSKPL